MTTSNRRTFALWGSQKEKRERGKILFEEIVVECFPNLGKKTYIQIQEVQRVPKKMNPKRPTPRHIIIKMSKVKDEERILKAAREKQLVTCNGTPIRLPADIFGTKFAGQKGVAQYIQSAEKKKKASNQDYCAWKNYHSESKEK